jgi:MFS family permease
VFHLGGVAQMNDFLEKFFPAVVVNKELEYELRKGNLYCQYNNQHLQAYISSFYLVGFVSTLMAATVTRRYGRKTSILIAGISFLIGVVLKTSAQNLAMLVLG